MRLGSLRGYGEPLFAGDVLRPEARLTPAGRSLEAIAQELYGLPMSEFTAARDREAAAARQAGDRALAGELKKLRRPTSGAWLTNQLVRQRGDDVAALLHLGAALRDAQARLATGDLRRLSQQGQQLVTALGREARQLGRDAGQRVGEGAVREVEDTLHAALADPAASDAVRAGRLTSALSYAGFGSVDVSGVAPSEADAGAPSRATPAPRPGRTPAPRPEPGPLSRRGPGRWMPRPGSGRLRKPPGRLAPIWRRPARTRATGSAGWRRRARSRPGSIGR